MMTKNFASQNNLALVEGVCPRLLSLLSFTTENMTSYFGILGVRSGEQTCTHEIRECKD